MKLFPHQCDVLNQTEGKNRVAYYLDMGLGKTFVGSEKMLSYGNRVNLVVCQKSKINDWVNHLAMYYEKQFTMIYDCTKWNRKDWEAFAKNPDEPCAMVINYELAWRRKELLNLKEFTLMLDESSLIQNSKAKQTKFILKLNAKNVILLSGTPCSGKYENLWTQAKLLGWEITEPLFLRQYVNFQTIEVGGVPIKIVDKRKPYKNEERLKGKFKDFGAVFMKTEEAFELPTQTYINVCADTIPEYQHFIKNDVVTVDENELIGNTQLTKLLYARQLCGQYSKEKLDAFRDLLQSTNDRIIVFYNFNDELDKLSQVAEELKKPCSFVNGPTKDLSAYESEENSVTFVQYQAGSKGLNLQKANKIVYFTPTLSVENWMQSQKRIHRIGQEKPCFYYKMIARRSVEEQIYRALERGVDYTDKLFTEDKHGS